MLGSIRYCLARLVDFTGRDARQTFWYYVLFLALLNVAISMAVTVPMTVDIAGGAMAAAKSEAQKAAFLARMNHWFAISVWVSSAASLVIMLLAAAAVVRRLHDSDHSGWWILLPVATNLASIVFSLQTQDRMQRVFESMLANTPGLHQAAEQQQQTSAYGMIGWIGLIAVFIFGILKPTEGPNRFGDAPVRE